ncbi:hypothetical protein [Hyalangium rubrum]|uniref:Integral membrane protein n=1 Tax=Hyalangium rubrum TaxID=3103134 RepID=A0ABU5GUB4_9BACT|nr:hypothetical protein [Hyalangium sp. s54d21]MDY7224778.1 hypothetical protein [Hyalangium sp. s54d21]
METATTLTLVACGLFFLTGLLTGIWKHSAMMTNASRMAPTYVDIAHRASLLYAFASLVLLKFIEFSPFPSWVNTTAAAAPLLFFAVAIGRYLSLARSNETDNQYKLPLDATRVVMPMLIVAEVGGFGVLFAGFLLRRFAGW